MLITFAFGLLKNGRSGSSGREHYEAPQDRRLQSEHDVGPIGGPRWLSGGVRADLLNRHLQRLCKFDQQVHAACERARPANNTGFFGCDQQLRGSAAAPVRPAAALPCQFWNAQLFFVLDLPLRQFAVGDQQHQRRGAVIMILYANG